MTTTAVAYTLSELTRMSSNCNSSSLTAMAPETQRGIPCDQHLIIDRTMDLVARSAAFPKRQMLKHKRSALLFMAFKARLIHVRHRSGRPGPCIRAMGIVAVRAGHMPFQNGMTVRKLKLCFLFHVAGKTHFWIFAGIDNLVAFAAAGLRMETPGTVAHLATLDLDAFHRNSNSLMGGKLKIPDFFFMTRAAGLRPDILGAGHLMVFDDFLESLDIDITAGRKKRNYSES